MSILKEIKERAKKAGKNIKKNYEYFKMGRKMEFDEKQNKLRQEMMKRAEKAGMYDAKKQKMMDEKVKMGKEI